MEALGRRRDQRRVVSLQALDHCSHIGPYSGVLPEQLIVEPRLEDAALSRVEVLDVLFEALQRVDESLDLLGRAMGDELFGLGEGCCSKL